ncbi:cobaltochelatase CobT-related protein [Parasphingorhabdus sp.]|uniref:cobaltochelatase CobT-related protein n=1 Tax=Parasphingorhabdus sp. TaxID=2709688 RepID=UPI003A8EAA0E
MWHTERSRPERPPAAGVDDPADPVDYSVFTDAHDRVMLAREFPDRLLELGPKEPRKSQRRIKKCWAKSLSEFEEACARIENQSTTFDLAPRLLAQANKIAITLLVDHSGSMRGEKIAETAAAIKWVAEYLTEKGIACEILGFTTSSWQGGFPRLEWIEAGKPAYPGRLNALLHVIYKSFDQNPDDQSWNTMLHPELLKENIDGEAISWAADRLRARTEPQKLLVVVSDGAPVDDSTLAENGPTILERHLLETLDQINRPGDIRIGGVGVGYDVNRYYGISAGSDDLSLLADTIFSVCSQLLQHEPR